MNKLMCDIRGGGMLSIPTDKYHTAFKCDKCGAKGGKWLKELHDKEHKYDKYMVDVKEG